MRKFYGEDRRNRKGKEGIFKGSYIEVLGFFERIGKWGIGWKWIKGILMRLVRRKERKKDDRECGEDEKVRIGKKLGIDLGRKKEKKIR